MTTIALTSTKNQIRYTKMTMSVIFCLMAMALCLPSQSVQGQNSPGISKATTDALYPLIPYPQELTPAEGAFSFNAQTVLVADKKLFSNEIDQLKSLLALPLKDSRLSPKDNFISFTLDQSLTHEEQYVLTITKDHILIKAKDNAGIFRAIETIRQLLPPSVESAQSSLYTSALQVPAVHIQDFPAYAYRGMHLDVARHFFSIDYLKKFIDRLALYKFNKFHLHLTDDEGWRIEIKKYPKLTQEGAWRSFDAHDSACILRAAQTGNPDMEIDTSHIKMIHGKKMYGGFYSQKEMKDLVRYALNRHIDIIPEIDMPGHSKTAIRLYPFLACSAGQEDGNGFSVPMCPCNESTFTFAENVYREIFKIFPYPYVHLGADEVNKTSWEQSAECAVTMKKEGVKNVDQLQSYFVRRMEKFFNQHGKKLIGWDEILEGGVTPSAIVMYWRSWVPDAPIVAARQGNKVIMTPGNPLYFDAIPDKNSLMNVYHFNPIPKGLNAKQAANIMGAQANSWTEYIPTTNRLEYMEYPRMLALAEVLWTNTTNDSSFLAHLDKQYDRMDVMAIHYRIPDIEGLLESNVFLDSAILSAKPPRHDLTIHYTTDGTVPSIQAPVLDHPLIIHQSTLVRLTAFNKKDNPGNVYNCQYTKEKLHPAVFVKRNYTGMNVQYYKADYKTVNNLDTAKAILKWNQTDLKVDQQQIKNTSTGFGLKYNGLITVPKDGVYSFYLTADDGAVLKIDQKVVVDNDGLHSAIEKNGQIALQKGSHFFQLAFIEGGGGYTLKLEYSQPGSSKKVAVPAVMLH